MNETETPAGVVHHFPGAPNRANLTLRDLADVYMANFPGRDTTRTYTVAFWLHELGDRPTNFLQTRKLSNILSSVR